MDNRPGGSQDFGGPGPSTSYLVQQQHQDSSHLLLTADDDTEDSRDAEDEKPSGYLREQDRFLPIANIARIMKKSIPKTGKVAKEARECVQECVSEFVSFITSEASDRCHQEKRKTINGEDILFAMQSLGFDNYLEPLKLYLQKYREANRNEKGVLGTSVASGSGGESPIATGVDGVGGGGEGVQPPTSNNQIQTIQSQPQTQTVLFAYDLGGQTHLQVQPTTSAGGANFTIG